MAQGPDQPWSPFPVQDWSSLPPDPLAASPLRPDGAPPPDGAPLPDGAPPPDGAPLPDGAPPLGWAPPPDWAPPADRRRWWLPLVVLGLVGALLSGVVYAASTVSTQSNDAAQAYLPPDGHVGYQRVETRDGTGLTTTAVVTESARTGGAAGVLGTDSLFGSQFVQLVLDQPDAALWRTTSTAVTTTGGDRILPQTTRMYSVDGAVELLGESRPDRAYAFQPALVELPSDVAPGQAWSSSGSAGRGLDYRSDMRAESAENGCLRVRGTLTLLAPGGGARAGELTRERTWCRGQGLVAESESGAGGQTSSFPAPVQPPAPRATDVALSWSAPERWTAAEYDTVSVDPTLGEGPMSGAPKSLAPVRTASGAVVRPLSAQRDLVATQLDPARRWVSGWRVHPGGEIVSLAGFGDVVVVTTSDRTVVAYSDRGVRLWQHQLDEIAPTAAVRLSDDQLVLVSLDGVVHTFGIVDGRRGWTASLTSDVTLPPAVGAGLVVVADRGGTTTALDARTGAERWTAPLLGTALAVTTSPAGGTVLVAQDQTVRALRATDGQHRWLRPFVGTVVGLQPLGDSVLLASKEASLLLDAAGAVTARLDPFLALTATPDHVVGWGASTASLVDSAGAVRARWPLPAEATVFGERPAVALPDGVLLFGSDWTVYGWTR